MTAKFTQCCRLTGPGRSAVAVIGVRGPRAVDVVVACFKINGPRKLQPLQVRYGDWHGGHPGADSDPQPGSESESIVICQTDDDTVEVHCHGGKAAIERIIADLEAHQITEIAATEWQSQREPLAISEARSVLSQCLTERTAAIAIQQTRGALVRWAESAKTRLRESDTHLADVRRSASKVADSSKFSTRLAEPFRVILAGQPNVGKSSLVNAIVGYQRSITFDEAGTTRDVLHCETVIDGLPIRISDTAGIRETDQQIEKAGISLAESAIRDADLLVWVTTPESDQMHTIDHANMIRVCNKSDLAADKSIDPGMISTIATTGSGVDLLISEIADQLVAVFPPTDSAVVVNQRQAECLHAITNARSVDAAVAAIDSLVHGSDR